MEKNPSGHDKNPSSKRPDLSKAQRDCLKVCIAGSFKGNLHWPLLSIPHKTRGHTHTHSRSVHITWYHITSDFITLLQTTIDSYDHHHCIALYCTTMSLQFSASETVGLWYDFGYSLALTIKDTDAGIMIYPSTQPWTWNRRPKMKWFINKALLEYTIRYTPWSNEPILSIVNNKIWLTDIPLNPSWLGCPKITMLGSQNS